MSSPITTCPLPTRHEINTAIASCPPSVQGFIHATMQQNKHLQESLEASEAKVAHLRTCIYATNTKIRMVEDEKDVLSEHNEELRRQRGILGRENYRLVSQQEAVLETAANVAEQMKQLRGDADANKLYYTASYAEERTRGNALEKELAEFKARAEELERELAAVRAGSGVKKKQSAGRKRK